MNAEANKAVARAGLLAMWLVVPILTGACGSDEGPDGSNGGDSDGAPQVACDGTWSTVSSTVTLPLFGVWASSTGTVYGVGGEGNSTAFTINGIDHYSDLVDCCFGADPFAAVWGSGNQLWAAGNNNFRGSILHYDGGSYSHSDNLGVGGPDWHFRGIWGASPSTIFVVGTGGGIMRGTTGNWAKMASGTSATLEDVWGVSATEVWAVGDASTILRWSGALWEREQDVPGGTQLLGVGGSGASDVWAVGDDGAALHWNGTTWTETDAGTSRTLRDVWAKHPTCAFAVGDDGLILKWDGARWQPAPNPVSGTTIRLHAIWGEGDRAYAVGDDGTMLRYQP